MPGSTSITSPGEALARAARIDPPGRTVMVRAEAGKAVASATDNSRIGRMGPPGSGSAEGPSAVRAEGASRAASVGPAGRRGCEVGYPPGGAPMAAELTVKPVQLWILN